MTGKDAVDIAVQPFGLLQVTVQRDGQRQIAVGDSFRLQFYQRVPKRLDSASAALSTIAELVPSVSCM